MLLVLLYWVIVVIGIVVIVVVVVVVVAVAVIAIVIAWFSLKNRFNKQTQRLRLLTEQQHPRTNDSFPCDSFSFVGLLVVC